MFSFNLVNEKWIPCIMPDGKRVDNNLIDTLLQAKYIKEIFDNSPLITISLHRFLLAIVHRSYERGYGPIDAKEWKALWEMGQFNNILLHQYLEKWRAQFDLFDSKYPFYQCASLPFSGNNSKGKTDSYEIQISSLIHESAAYLDKATLFDHTTESHTLSLSPLIAARKLLAFQSFALGKLLSKPRIKGEESAKAAPLVKGAFCLVKGNNLFETLMLNLHVYNPEDEEPFHSGSKDKPDKPAWEQDEETKAEDREPNGYFDLITWQSRRIKLHPKLDENGQVGVDTFVIRKGAQFPANYSLHGKEPMLAFHKVKKPAKGQSPWLPLTFLENRVLWRDSLTLFQPLEKTRPKILEWLSDLTENNIIPLSATYDLNLIGLISDRAKILLWRHERLPLPLKLIKDETLVARLEEALELAEGISEALNITSSDLAKLIIAPDAKRLNDNQKKEVESLTISLSADRAYWANLGISFSSLIIRLADDKYNEGADTLIWWAAEIRRAGIEAFRDATNSLDRSGRWLKAVTLAKDDFERRLNTILKPYRDTEKKGGEA